MSPCRIYLLVHIKGQLETTLSTSACKQLQWSRFTGRSQQENFLRCELYNETTGSCLQWRSPALPCSLTLNATDRGYIEAQHRLLCYLQADTSLSNTTAGIRNKRCQRHKGIWCKPYSYFCLSLSSKAALERHVANQKAKRTEERSLMYCL